MSRILHGTVRLQGSLTMHAGRGRSSFRVCALIVAANLFDPETVQAAGDGSFCGFLTRPSIRADGGGTNFHAGGQFLCHEGRAKRCESHRWVDKGSCAAFGNLPHAHEVEGSEPKEEGEREAGDSTTGSRPGAAGTGGGLIGDSPEALQLDREAEQLEREREALERGRRRDDPRSGAGAGTSAGERSGTGTAGSGEAEVGPRCSELSRAIADADRQLSAIANYSNAFTNDGSTASEMRGAKAALEQARAAYRAESARLGCR